jgi:lipid-binding SYLF domain-containing protein
MREKKIAIFSALFVLIVGLCSSNALFGPKGATAEDKQTAVLQDKDDVLEKLYAQRPETKEKIANAPGYATFNNKNINLLMLSSGHGYGVVVDNRTGEKTYMRMGSLGGGLGMGVKDFRAVFIFKRPEAMEKFIQSGWQFSGQGDVGAKTTTKGAAASEAAVVNPDMDIYQMTERGVALQATIQGTKYWMDKELNK